MKIKSYSEFNTNESKLGTIGAVLLSVAINFATLFYHDKNQHEKIMKNKLSTALRSTFSYSQGKNSLVMCINPKKILSEEEFKSIYGNDLNKLDQEALYSHYEWCVQKIQSGKITYDIMKDQLSGMPKHLGVSIYSNVDSYQDDKEVE